MHQFNNLLMNLTNIFKLFKTKDFTKKLEVLIEIRTNKKMNIR